MVEVILKNQNPGNTDWWSTKDRWDGGLGTRNSICSGNSLSPSQANQRCRGDEKPWYYKTGFVKGIYRNMAMWYCLDRNKVKCKKLTNSTFPGTPIKDSWTIQECGNRPQDDLPTGKCSYNPVIDKLNENQRGDYAKLVIDNWGNVIEGGTTVMKNYCLEDIESENCPGAKTCPRMVSGIGQAGKLCDDWYKKDKTNASQYMKEYCKNNPTAYWCNCISGDDNRNDLYPVFDAISRIPGTDANERQCWFQPCKEKSNMLIPQDYDKQNLKCEIPKCTNINIQVSDRGGTINNKALAQKIICEGNRSDIKFDGGTSPDTPDTPDEPDTPDTPDAPDNMNIYIIILILILLGLVVAFVG